MAMLGYGTPWPWADAHTETEMAITAILFTDVLQPTQFAPSTLPRPQQLWLYTNN